MKVKVLFFIVMLILPIYAQAWQAPSGYEFKEYIEGGAKFEFISNLTSKSDKVIFMIHGGAFAMPLNDNYRNVAVKYSQSSDNANVLVLDQTYLPKNAFPDQIHEALDAWSWLNKQGYIAKNIIVTGDSSGGNLALAFVERLIQLKKETPRAIIVMSPLTDFTGAYLADYNGPGKEQFMGFLEKQAQSGYAAGKDIKNPLISPAFADLSKFPPIFIQAAEKDILLGDSKQLYEFAKKSGNEAKLSIYPDTPHVFQLNLGSDDSKKAFIEIEEFIHAMWKN